MIHDLELNADNENNEGAWKTSLNEVGDWTQAGDREGCIMAMVRLAVSEDAVESWVEAGDEEILETRLGLI